MKKIIDWVKENRKSIILAITMWAGIYLFMETFRNLCYGTESEYQIFRDYFFYRAASFFLVIVLFLRKVRVKNLYIPIILVTYAGYAIRYLNDTKDEYGADYAQYLHAKFVAEGLFLIVMVDLIRGCISEFNKQNKVLLVLVLASFVMMNALNYTLSKGIILPLLIFFLIPISKEKWIRVTDCMAVGYYIAYAWIMTKSLITVPYVEDIGVFHGRYYGTFLNIGTEGAFAGCAFVCCVYLIKRITEKGWKLNILEVLLVVAAIYPCVVIGLTCSRSAQMGLVFTLIMVFIFLSRKSTRERRIKRSILVLTVSLACIGGGTLGLIWLSHLDAEAVKAGISNQAFANTVYYWIGRGQTLANGVSKYGVFPSGSVLNAIDRFSSDRLSIAVESIRTTTWFGSDAIAVYTDKLEAMNPHNSYLTWTRAYGWIGGTVVIAAFFCFFVATCKSICKGEKTALLPFLWGAFCVGLFLTETMLWVYPAAFGLLLLFHPFITEQPEEGEGLSLEDV